MSEDPLGSSPNLYTYCDHDPVNYVDPDGLFIDLLFDIPCLAWDIKEYETTTRGGERVLAGGRRVVHRRAVRARDRRDRQSGQDARQGARRGEGTGQESGC